MTQAATRLMLASKKSSPMCVRSEVAAAHQFLRRSPRSSSVSITTWSLSQRTPRLTCSRISSSHMQHRRELVGDRLGRMEVARVEAEQLLVRAPRSRDRTRASRRRSSPSRCRIACSRRRRGCARGRAARRRSRRAIAASRSRGPRRSIGSVLVAVGNPDVGHAGRAERLADRGADLPAGDAVLDPELADAFVACGEREAVGRLGMGEERRIEIQPDPVGSSPSRSSLGNARARFRCGRRGWPPNSP